MGKNAQPSANPTLISKGCVLVGNIQSEVFIRIDGHVKGDLLLTEGLIIGESGLVEGNVNSREIVVYGTVTGVVKAGSVDVKSSGKIFGEIHTKTFQLERGAQYSGRVTMGVDNALLSTDS